jgi:hypothetical protein
MTQQRLSLPSLSQEEITALVLVAFSVQEDQQKTVSCVLAKENEVGTVSCQLLVINIMSQHLPFHMWGHKNQTQQQPDRT